MELQEAAGSFGYDVQHVRHVMFGVLSSAVNLSQLESICWIRGSSLLEERLWLVFVILSSDKISRSGLPSTLFSVVVLILSRVKKKIIGLLFVMPLL